MSWHIREQNKPRHFHSSNLDMRPMKPCHVPFKKLNMSNLLQPKCHWFPRRIISMSANQMVAFGHQGQNSTNSQALRLLKSLWTAKIYKPCFLKISDSAQKGIRKISDLNCGGFVSVFGFDVTVSHLRVAWSGLATEDKVAFVSELKKEKEEQEQIYITATTNNVHYTLYVQEYKTNARIRCRTERDLEDKIR